MHLRWELTPSPRYQPAFVGSMFIIAGGLLIWLGHYTWEGEGVRTALQHGEPNSASLIAVGLGLFFLSLGSGMVAMAAWAVRIRNRCPWNLAAWGWWTHTLAGSVGALSFALPSGLAFPLLLVASRNRPNLFFPGLQDSASRILWIGAGFSVLGLGSLVAWIWIVRRAAVARPRWRRRRDHNSATAQGSAV